MREKKTEIGYKDIYLVRLESSSKRILPAVSAHQSWKDSAMGWGVNRWTYPVRLDIEILVIDYMVEFLLASNTEISKWYPSEHRNYIGVSDSDDSIRTYHVKANQADAADWLGRDLELILFLQAFELLVDKT